VKSPADDDGLDFHDPTAGIGGAPPARSALGLRLVLAVFGVIACSALAAVLAVAGSVVGAVILALCAVVAIVDVAVVSVRLRRQRAPKQG
jgi:hypothetical protein